MSVKNEQFIPIHEYYQLSRASLAFDVNNLVTEYEKIAQDLCFEEFKSKIWNKSDFIVLQLNCLNKAARPYYMKEIFAHFASKPSFFCSDFDWNFMKS